MVKVKNAPGSCKLRVEETETRDAIVTDGHAMGTQRTIAYVAIGAEDWGPLLAASSEMLSALINARHLLASIARVKPFGQQGHDIQIQIDAVIAKAQS
jgi:hypothetical protein